MKKLLICFFILMVHKQTQAQTDSSAYNTQRNRINSLLSERSNKFSQYENSLTSRTGIFGLKTKRDMQASNDILTRIVQTDNNIFSELKVLLDYKDFEKKEVENRAVTVESRVDRFQRTITSLQQENDKLKAERESLTKRNNKLVFYLVVLLVLALVLALLPRIKKLLRADRSIVK